MDKKMTVCTKDNEYEVRQVLSEPGATYIYTDDGCFIIRGFDADGKDFRQIMSEEGE